MNNTEEKILYPHIEIENSAEALDLRAHDAPFAAVRVFEPVLRDERIVLPLEITDLSGAVSTLGVALDRENLRELLSAYEFDEFIE